MNLFATVIAMFSGKSAVFFISPKERNITVLFHEAVRISSLALNLL